MVEEQIPEMKRVLKPSMYFTMLYWRQPEYTDMKIITAELDSQGNVLPASGSELYNYLKNL
jgi:hypothetical protein